MSEPSDRPLFSYVIRLGVPEDAPRIDLDHGEDLTIGRFATVTLEERLVVPFSDECEMVLAPGSEVTGLVVEKETSVMSRERDAVETAFRVVGEAVGRQ